MRIRFAPFTLLLVLLLAPSFAKGDLRPEEVAIIAMRTSEASKEMASYYAKARNIPESHICLIDGHPGEDMARSQWDKMVRPAIRRWLVEKQLQAQIRCFVTVWDVPLRIRPRDSDSQLVTDRRTYLLAERQIRAQQILELIQRIEELLPNGEAAAEPPLDATASSKAIGAQLDSANNRLQKRLVASRGTAEGQSAGKEMESIYAEGAGLSGIARILASQPNLRQNNPQLASRADTVLGQVQGLTAGFVALQSLPDSVERDQQLIALGQQTTGLMGTLIWIDQELEQLQQNESAASFDSELSLLFWPDYPILRWQPNVLYYKFDRAPLQRRRLTMMVSRLEAPTIELTKMIIDDAIETEKSGLEGTVYLDARGHAFQGAAGSTGDYDESIRNLAKLLKDHTKLPVVLDNEERLFGEGECPDAALYCGWYSLARYVDAFQWKRGAVAYHIASSEAETLRQPDSQVWCKRLLESGVAATLGPTFEPYLHAFPRPEDFFVVLLSGRYSLVETYYRTLPLNSWAMVLVGDPLYNPFKVNPPLSGEGLPLSVRRLLGEAPEGEAVPVQNEDPATP